MRVQPGKEFLGTSTVAREDLAGCGVLHNTSGEAESLRHVEMDIGGREGKRRIFKLRSRRWRRVKAVVEEERR